MNSDTEAVMQTVSAAMLLISNAAPSNLQNDDDMAAHDLYVLDVLLQEVGRQHKKRMDFAKEIGRAKGDGTTIVTEHYQYSFKVGNPQERFDKDAFITAVSEEFKIPKHKLVSLAQLSTKPTAAPVTVTIEIREADGV